MNNFDDNRPDPDAILSEIKKGDTNKGKLKIFLGYAPGVGKTYSMLVEAHLLKKRGVDVIIGYIETHKRDETNSLIVGLETIARKVFNYKDITLEELDVQAVIARKPKIVLVDEFAHSNAPGSSHPKRYLDINELLENGIDVFTTVNIQHFESQNDIVAQITGVRVQETIPDILFEEADEIKLIDIPLQELLQRLEEGKVYVPEQARNAIQNFFRKGNLTALREITLRKVASKMDTELNNYKRARAINELWPVQDKIMVCVSPSPFAKQLVRRGYNLAIDSGIDWYVVYVATPKFKTISQKGQKYLSDTFELAEKLGGKIFTLTGSDIADELIAFAKDKNITRLLMGKPLGSQFLEFIKNSPTNKLMYDQSPFDVQLITPLTETTPTDRDKQAKRIKKEFNVRNYFTSLLFLIPLTLIIFLLERFLPISALGIIYIIAPISAALLYGIGPAIFISLLSVICYNFFFIEPRLSFNVNRPEQFISLLIFLSVAVVVSQLINRSKRHYLALQLRLESLSILEDLSGELLNIPLSEDILKEFVDSSNQQDNIIRVIKTTILEDIAQIAVKYIHLVSKNSSLILLKDEKHNLKLFAKMPSNIELSAKISGVAAWAVDNNLLAGNGTENLTEVEWFFIPITLSNGNTIGVIGIQASYKELFLEQRNLINTVIKLSSMAVSNWI